MAIIGSHFIKDKKNYRYTYNKNEIKHGVTSFNIKKDNIEKLIKKFSIKKVVTLSALSDPDYCYANIEKNLHAKSFINKKNHGSIDRPKNCNLSSFQLKWSIAV